MSLNELTLMSNRYGREPRYVLAGGGNTSYKNEGVLYVKGSGAALASILPEQFVRLDRHKLSAIWKKTYPSDFDARETAALKDLMDARLPGETGRPSVETLLHDIIDYKFVCHLHPGAVNALTCAVNGEEAAKRLFPDAIWVDAIMPGYILAAALKRQLDGIQKHPDIIFIQNHGVFVGGDTVEAIDACYEKIMNTLDSELKRAALEPALTDTYSGCDAWEAARVAAAIRALAWQGGASYVRFLPNKAFVENGGMFAKICLTLTPDHMVYCGSETLYVEGDGFEDIAEQIEQAARNAPLPRVIGVRGVGLYACGSTLRECDAAHDLLADALRILDNARAFGGAQSMPDELVRAISGWEVERYRKSRVMGGADARAAGKIALVTGGAQGFGLGIASGLAGQGAAAVIADLNGQGADEAAQGISSEFGAGMAHGIRADVGSEASVKDAVAQCVLRYGGLDVMIANAGIVRAGGLEELPLDDFELCTKVNYTAFFLCAKYASMIMKIHRRFMPSYTADIIQINSKSGISGSNRNFAYSGAKFGGIGLVQSFALELAGEGIKVNAVCPGNFLDGPLWADPEKGLFVQYLKAGKVPGAKTIDDVRRYYESRVPMGRGCRVPDVVRAILYIMEQQYETGQALPVTGGQEMLK